MTHADVFVGAFRRKGQPLPLEGEMTLDERAEQLLFILTNGKEQPGYIVDLVSYQMGLAVAEEREACAKIADDDVNGDGELIAAAIRART